MKEKNLIISIAINIVISSIEIIAGLLIGSLAIVSDAVHNFSDVGAMTLSLFAEKASSKKSDTKHTYGYQRTEVLIALLNSVFLLVSIGFIGYEAIQRLFHPQLISGGWMLIMAVVAFIGNSIATKLLHARSKESINMRSAFLHSLQDALFAGGVILAAILILLLNWQWADAIISLTLSIYLFKEAITIILQTVHIFMEGVPSSLDIEKLKNDLLVIPKIETVSDLHVWNTGSKDIILTAHIIAKLENDSDYAITLRDIHNLIYSKYKITHSTIQLLTPQASNKLKDISKHCS